MDHSDPPAGGHVESLHEFRETFSQTLKIAAETLVEGNEATIVPPPPPPNTDVRALVSSLPQLHTEPTGEVRAELDLRKTLGEGGMGIVRLAEQLSLGREVAVKSLRPEHGGAEQILQLLREAWITGWLEHPSIIPIYTLGVDRGGRPMIVMKRIEGTPWSAYIRGAAEPAQLEPGASKLEWHLRVLMQVCNAVQFANAKGMIHRDLKPDNVMIGRFGEVYVLDWGIAVSLREDARGRLPLARDARGVAGTPGYMAPEMVEEGVPKLSTRTDVYLLGAILHEVITGRPPHTGRNVLEALFSSYRSDEFAYEASVPAELAAIAHRAMRALPEERFEDAEKLRQAVAEFLGHQSSRTIAAEASSRLIELQAMLGDGSSPVDQVAAYKIFGECRFGFTQSLRAWPENPDAKSGLDRCLLVMLEYEMARENLAAASALFAEITSPGVELTARLEALRARVTEKERALAKLERLEADRNLELGRRTRSFLATAVAFLWGFAPLGFGLADTFWNYRVSYGWYAIVFSLLTLEAIWGTYWASYSLTRTFVNRQITASVYLVGAGVVMTKIAGYVLGLSLEQSILFDFALYVTITGATAIATDRRLAWSAVIGLAGFAAACRWFEHVFYVLAATNFGSFLCAAALWRPRSWEDFRAPRPE